MCWLSDEEFNALPEKMRNYIHDLHLGYDPRGDVRQQLRELELWKESSSALALENARLRRVIKRLMRNSNG